MYNYNLSQPQVLEVDKTVRSFQELRNINGQNYVTITASEGRKLMQRIPEPAPTSIERVLAKGQDEIFEDEADKHADFILIESKEYKKKHKGTLKGAGSEFFHVLTETAKLQVRSLSFYQAIVAEFIGVFILTFVVCGLGINMSEDSTTPSINGALGGGLTLATMVWCTNCISGGNLNPAISIVLVFTSDLDPLRGVFYVISQLLGALAGAATLSALLPSALHSQIAITSINSNVSILKAFSVELIITFLLAFTVFACLDKNRKDLGGSFPLAIGLAVTCGALFGVNIQKNILF
jgi:glycerol uptake facilitator-like aquaporin